MGEERQCCDLRPAKRHTNLSRGDRPDRACWEHPMPPTEKPGRHDQIALAGRVARPRDAPRMPVGGNHPKPFDGLMTAEHTSLKGASVHDPRLTRRRPRIR